MFDSLVEKVVNRMLVTPENSCVFAGGNTIVFPPLMQWEDIDPKRARAKEGERIAPLDFENRIARFQQGETVNLAGERQLRLGCSVCLLVNNKPVFGQFDSGHPSRPGHLTPPAGVFEAGTPLEAALKELAEEFILLSPENQVRTWVISRSIESRTYINPVRAQEYAKANNLVFDPKSFVRVSPIERLRNQTIVQLGGIEYWCLVEFEPDTSSVELIFPMKADLPEGWRIVDGERLPDGSWRNTPVITGDYAQYPLTTKAEICLATFGREGRSYQA